jgi:hypothetical protein
MQINSILCRKLLATLLFIDGILVSESFNNPPSSFSSLNCRATENAMNSCLHGSSIKTASSQLSDDLVDKNLVHKDATEWDILTPSNRSKLSKSSSLLQQLPDLKKTTTLLGFDLRSARKWATTGTSTVNRAAHFALGGGSLLFGANHFSHMLTEGFDIPCTQIEVIILGGLHTATAFLGSTHLSKNKRSKTIEASRNAMIWPVPYQNLWLTCMALTAWSRGSTATLSMNSAPIVLFTIVNVIIVLWQISTSFVSGGTNESERVASGIWYENPAVNAAVTVGSYSGIMIIFLSMAIWNTVIATTIPGYMQEFAGFIDAFPSYGFLMSNIFMNFAFVNNVAVFFATLLKYKVIPSDKVVKIYLFIIFLSVQGISKCCLTTDAGEAASIMFSGLLASGEAVLVST